MKFTTCSGEIRRDLLPTTGDLERVRDLAAAFPEAKLNRVGVVRSARLDIGHVRVFLAIESLQITGSFKVRGALSALGRLRERGVTNVVAASAGNHGAGVAHAARVLGLDATIVVPKSAPQTKLAKIEGDRVTVIKNDGGYDAAEGVAIRLAEARGVPFVSPYDDVDVLAGNGGSLGFEIADALATFDARTDLVYAPIGGGGLATGLACALDARRRIVWGVQSEASPAFALSIARGEAVTTLDQVETLAEGLEGGISERGFARAAGVLAGAVVVSEDAIARAMRFAEDELGLVLEGSAAVALAPILDPRLPPDFDATNIVVVLTGRNVDRCAR